MEISMRHTKLKAEEAALLAGELKKPSWQSSNEGIHERVSFEDSIWGFSLAGGSFYNTPLRVTAVKPDSRADKAGIRPGDKLLRINDIDTSTLTIQEAHEIIIESGIHLRIAVTAPEDEEDSYFCYEDPIDTGYDSEEERRLEEEKARKRQVHAKVSSYWSLQWPWVSKRRIIYRESNCYLVPSKYEHKYKDKFKEQPVIRREEDIVLYSDKKDKNANKTNLDNTAKNNVNSEKVSNKPENIMESSVNGESQLKNIVENGNINNTVLVQQNDILHSDKPSENSSDSIVENGHTINGELDVIDNSKDTPKLDINEIKTASSLDDSTENITNFDEHKEKDQFENPGTIEIPKNTDDEDNDVEMTTENQNIFDDLSKNEKILDESGQESIEDALIMNDVINGNKNNSSEDDQNILDDLLSEENPSLGRPADNEREIK